MAFGLKYSAYKNNQRDTLYISQKMPKVKIPK